MSNTDAAVLAELREKREEFQGKYAAQKRYAARTRYAAQRKYNKENIKQVKIDVNLNTEQDVLGWLEAQDNKAGAIKALIRKEIDRLK